MKPFAAVFAALAALSASLLAGCAADESDYTIAVIPKGLGHQFWNAVRDGAEDAAAERNARVLWRGPAQETEIAKQISIVEDMVNSGADGIVMAACDASALVGTVENAAGRGVTVVTIDSGVDSDAPVSFVATDNVAGARQAADTLAELIGGAGPVGLIPFVSGAATSEQRERGFRERVAELEGVELASVLYCDSDVAKAMEAATDMMASNPDLKGIFAANEPACIGAINAIEAAGKAGEVKLVAFDASQEQLSALERGSVQALIVQDPYRMGYEGVIHCIDAIDGKEVPERVDTGITVVTQDNLDEPAVQALLNPG